MISSTQGQGRGAAKCGQTSGPKLLGDDPLAKELANADVLLEQSRRLLDWMSFGNSAGKLSSVDDSVGVFRAKRANRIKLIF